MTRSSPLFVVIDCRHDCACRLAFPRISEIDGSGRPNSGTGEKANLFHAPVFIRGWRLFVPKDGSSHGHVDCDPVPGQEFGSHLDTDIRSRPAICNVSCDDPAVVQFSCGQTESACNLVYRKVNPIGWGNPNMTIRNGKKILS